VELTRFRGHSTFLGEEESHAEQKREEETNLSAGVSSATNDALLAVMSEERKVRDVAGVAASA
jgi:hypothetical protein